MIVFCADHGEMMGSHGMNSKNNFYDESARVPLIIRFPGRIPAGKRVTVPISNIDIRPTIEDYLNMPETKVDGKSLRPFIEDNYNKVETYFAVSEWYNDKIPGFMVRTATHKLMIAHTAEAKNTAIDGFYNLVTDSLEQNNILKLTTIPQIEKDKAQALKVLLVKWLKKVNSPYYYSVKARPLGRMNANYSLYQNDIAKIKIPGITNITGLHAGVSFKILTNDTIQITTTNNPVGLMGTTATISGGNTQVRFEVMPAIEVSTSNSMHHLFDQKDFVVSSNSNELTINVQNQNLKNLSAQIFTIDGKLILQKTFETYVLKINTSMFQKGNYLVKITNGVLTTTRKLIVT
jgi:hypothetical protein